MSHFCIYISKTIGMDKWRQKKMERILIPRYNNATNGENLNPLMNLLDHA